MARLAGEVQEAAALAVPAAEAPVEEDAAVSVAEAPEAAEREDAETNDQSTHSKWNVYFFCGANDKIK